MGSGLANLVSETATKKPYFKTIDLTRVRIDGGTQQRPHDPAVLADYTERLRDGSEPPPLRAVFDGENYWLWDGFHRYDALLANGIKEYKIYITKGTQRDAVWLSFSANKEHGLQRPPGVVREIVEKILADDDWKKAPAKAIAEHVGATQRYVERVLAEVRSGKTPGDAKPRGGTRSVTRGGKTYEMNVGNMRGGTNRTAPAENGNGSTAETNGDAAPPAPEFKPVTTDALGAELIDPAIIDAFTRIAILKRMVKSVRDVVAEANAGMESKDTLFRFLDAGGFKNDSDNMIEDLKAAAPYALCPVHPNDATARKGCKWCRGGGWVTRAKHKLATESMSAAANDKK